MWGLGFRVHVPVSKIIRPEMGSYRGTLVPEIQCILDVYMDPWGWFGVQRLVQGLGYAL